MATSKKRLQVYVSDSTYQRIKALADIDGVSISEAAAEILSTYDASSSQSLDALPSGPSDFVTRDDFQRFQNELHRSIGELEGRYKAHAESLMAFQTKSFELVLESAQSSNLLPPSETPDETPPETPKRSRRRAAPKKD